MIKVFVKRKKKVPCQPPPEKYHFEKKASDLALQKVYGISILEPEYETEKTKPTDEPAPLYAISWGWNASKRAGNVTAVEVREPSMVQRSIKHSYMTASAGMHHSVLLSDDGSAYTFGEGRSGQLGIGNPFSDHLGGYIQSFPRAANPTGSTKYSRGRKRDIKMVEVAAGCNFSIGREMNLQEALRLCLGLKEMMENTARQLKMYPDSPTLQRTWCIVRHEMFLVEQGAGGLLCSWGKGTRGELGIGPVDLLSHPTVIPRMIDRKIVQVSAGANHVLAIDTNAILFSWGRGGGGRLGHGDFEDRHYPTMVEHFQLFFVEYCAAGDAHSAVLTTSRKTQRDIQIRRVITFGRNGQGRLGNGSTNNMAYPISVDKWLPSLQGMQVRQLACGGAHTLALLTKKVKPTLANPWGIETAVAAWGYGLNGQLGTGYSNHSFIPTKSRVPRWEIVSEISAGRSWSMARTISGELYTWGKGLRGQIGQGKIKFSLAPVKLDTFASFVKLNAGYSHNLCIATQKSFLNPKIAESLIGKSDPLEPLVEPNLEKQVAKSTYLINCCRTDTMKGKSSFRVSCIECAYQYICFACSKLCHRNHRLTKTIPRSEDLNFHVEVKPEAERVFKASEPMSAYARITQGSGNFRVKKIQKRPQHEEEQEIVSIPVFRVGTPSSKPSSAAPQEERGKLNVRPRSRSRGANSTDVAAMRSKKYLASVYSYQEKLRVINHFEHNQTSVHYCQCGLLNTKCRVLPSIKEDEEVQRRIDAANAIQRLGRRYCCRKKLAIYLKHRDQLRKDACEYYWNKHVLGKIWEKIERAHALYRETREPLEMEIEDSIRHKYDYNRNLQGALQGMAASLFGVRLLLRGACPLIKNNLSMNLFPSYSMSCFSIRAQQMQLSHEQRLSPEDFAIATRDIPRYDKRECVYFDKDVNKIMYRFIKTVGIESWRKDMDRRAIIAAERAISLKREAQLERLRKQGRKVPPPPPALSPYEQLIFDRKKKRDEERKAAEEAEMNKDDDVVFDPFKRKKKLWLRRRRHSISDPCQLYGRITHMGEHVILNAVCRRRNSLPNILAELHLAEMSRFTHIDAVNNSLLFFQRKNIEVKELFDPEYHSHWKRHTKRNRRIKIRNVMNKAILTPRLPIEIRGMLLNGERRRTLAEPERFQRQLVLAAAFCKALMFGTRDSFAEARIASKRVDNAPVRRRSFDFGEHMDDWSGLLQETGEEFEPPYDNLTLTELMKFKLKIEGIIFRKELSLLKEEFDSKNDADMEAFEPIFERERELDMGRMSGAIPAAESKPRVQAKVWGARKPPVIWQEHFTDEGYTYYYKVDTGESLWEMPTGSDVQIQSQYQDSSGSWYWYNNVTGNIEWI